MLARLPSRLDWNQTKLSCHNRWKVINLASHATGTCYVRSDIHALEVARKVDLGAAHDYQDSFGSSSRSPNVVVVFPLMACGETVLQQINVNALLSSPSLFSSQKDLIDNTETILHPPMRQLSWVGN